MIPLDHDAKRGSPFCPMMGAKCVSGTTPGMKGVKCAAWRSLPMFDRQTNVTREVFACSVYEWPPALGFEISGIMQQNRASVDKMATESVKLNISFCGAAQAALELKEKQIRLLDAENQNEKTG